MNNIEQLVSWLGGTPSHTLLPWAYDTDPPTCYDVYKKAQAVESDIVLKDDAIKNLNTALADRDAKIADRDAEIARKGQTIITQSATLARFQRAVQDFVDGLAIDGGEYLESDFHDVANLFEFDITDPRSKTLRYQIQISRGNTAYAEIVTPHGQEDEVRSLLEDAVESALDRLADEIGDKLYGTDYELVDTEDFSGYSVDVYVV